MRKLDAYILSSMLRTLFHAVLLISFVVVLFDVFANLDQYLRNDVPYGTIGRISLLYVPQALLYAIGPAALFATTYFLSMLHANNEMIILSNIGYPFRRIIMTLLLLGLLLAFLHFLIQETLAIPASQEKLALSEEATGIRNLNDNRDVTLQAPDGTYVMYARRYLEETRRITNVTVLKLDAAGRLRERIVAASGTFNGTYWELKDVIRHRIDLAGTIVVSERLASLDDESISLESQLFRNVSSDIGTMELEGAFRYVRRIRMMDANQYAQQASRLYERLLGNLTPLILMIISCSTVFTWRKNVLILSILASLAIAVVYFVMQMLSMILARQGIYAPLWGPLAPMLALLGLSGVIATLRRI